MTQLHIYLMMKKSIVIEDNNLNYKPLKMEKYKQVFSKHYFLEVFSSRRRNFRVFRDAGNHWVEVPVAKEDAEYWRIPLVSVHRNSSCQPVFKENLHVVMNPKETDPPSGYIGE